jgi:hypothetical protein
MELVGALSPSLLKVGQDRLNKARKSARAAAALLRGTAAGADPKACEAICFRALVLVASRAFDFSRAWKEQIGSGTNSDSDGSGSSSDSGSDSGSSCGSDGSTGTMAYVLVPFADLFNHPSASALAQAGPAGVAFQQRSPRAACIDVKANFDLTVASGGCGGGVSVFAPLELPVEGGNELWNWYSNAGFGSKTRGEMTKAVLEFHCAYGFNPWL